jgi:two-component system, chemotaxis family, sensor kinase CheA
VDELIKDFLQESTENLDRLDQDFVKLESEPENPELIKSIFRTIHTIKGTCGFLGFTKLEALTHAGESLLSLMRDGALHLTEASADALLEMVDAVRRYLHEIEASGLEGDADSTNLIAKLKKLQERPAEEPTVASAPTAPPASATLPSATLPSAPKLEENAGTTKVQKETAGPKATDPPGEPKPRGAKQASPKHELMSKRLGGALVQKAHLRPEDILRALELQRGGDPRRLGEILVELGLVTTQQVEDILRESKQEEPKEAAIRVDVNLLEKQMNLVSELVLLRNRLLQIAAEANERNLNSTVHGLNYVTSELRKNVMKTRMQPVSQLFDKLPRIVRDISKDMGKKIRLETQGGGTELDKTLLEAIKDPVTHILRNSVDHGVETPEQRAAQGKPQEGIVSVRAFHEGGNFHLEVRDDGAGIDARRVKEKALAKGLITPAQAEKMTETEAMGLIFLPGLSTAEKVTNVSGRGVGMDVVKTNIERIGGRAKIDSERGRGTTMRLEIPLTLATIPALTVVSGKSVFAIPQAALVEMIGLGADRTQEYIECIDGTSVFRFRGMVLPLINLTQEFQLKDSARTNRDTINLVVVRTEGRQIALQVDSVRSTEEIVIKPLDKRFKSIALYAGAAVLGDGRVALILDIAALARRAGMVATQQARSEQAESGQRKERLTLLLLGGPDGERMAMPLDRVQRLEEFDATAKEPLAGHLVMQYRGEILPVVQLADLLDERRAMKRTEEGLRPPEATGKISAVVVKGENHKEVILEVHRILGIVKVEIEKLNPPSRPGVRGSLVVQERVTELLEMKDLLTKIGTEAAMESLPDAAGVEMIHGN